MRVTCALVAGLVLVGHAGGADDAKTEMAKLEGEWSMVSGKANGTAMPDDLVKSGKRTAKDGETAVSVGGAVYFKAKFTVDPTKKPKAIDYTMTEGPTKGKTQLGIYELDGDTVKFCFAAPGKDRPTDFTADAGSQRTLSVWKRDKQSPGEVPPCSGSARRSRPPCRCAPATPGTARRRRSRSPTAGGRGPRMSTWSSCSPPR
jgi:uncharacterized protein (TIGR03067 family)